MFTRIPTFIPTASVETVNEQPSRRKEAKNSTYGVGQGRRKRAKATRKRIAGKNTESNSFGQLPVISGRDSRARTHTLQTPTHFHKLRNSKVFQSRTASPYTTPTTPAQKERIISELNRKVRSISEYEDSMMLGSMSAMETELTQEQSKLLLTQPTMYTRNRRKPIDDIHDTQVKKQAKRWVHAREDSNVDYNNTSTTLERVVENLTDTESIIGTPLPSEIQSSLKSSSIHHYDNEVSKSFKSKIPVRFPDIQENKRYTESKAKYNGNKLTTHLPPIVSVKSSKSTLDSPGNVTQSILDYQSIVEQDFKRLGENLENTFKLLQQYIKCSTNTGAST
jgi:hypothetical protein